MERLASRMKLSCFQYLHRGNQSLVSPAESVQAAHRIFFSTQRTNPCISIVRFPSFAVLLVEIVFGGIGVSVLFLKI